MLRRNRRLIIIAAIILAIIMIAAIILAITQKKNPNEAPAETTETSQKSNNDNQQKPDTEEDDEGVQTSYSLTDNDVDQIISTSTGALSEYVKQNIGEMTSARDARLAPYVTNNSPVLGRLLDNVNTSIDPPVFQSAGDITSINIRYGESDFDVLAYTDTAFQNSSGDAANSTKYENQSWIITVTKDNNNEWKVYDIQKES